MTHLGAFALESVVGEGGMARVYRGRHRELGLPVAVKVLGAAQAQDPMFVDAFRGEVRAVASLDHPGVIWVHEHGRVSPGAAVGALVAGAPYLVMELADGTLADHPPTDWAALRGLLTQLLAALAHCHARGVVHRDIKGANILRRAPGQWMLSDFGIAWLGQAPERAGRAVGSPNTMAPEQAQGRWRDLGPWTDLYALGCVAWRLATGLQPFQREDAAATMRAQVHDPPPPFRAVFDAPIGLQAWLRRMLRKDCDLRFRNAAEAATALAALEPGAAAVPAPPRRSAQMLGAGLSLYGLRALPLADREPEREALLQALAQAEGGQGAQVVLLRGPAGVGKTRLATWLSETAAEAGRTEVLRATHGAQPGPNDGLPPALEEHTRTAALPPAERLIRLRRLLGPLLPISPREPEALAELLAPASPRQRAESPDLIALDAGARHAVARRYLEFLGNRTPVLLVLDDLHRSTDSAAFLDALVRWQDLRLARILVVATLRDDERLQPETARLLAGIEASPRSRTLTLAPLDRRASQELAEEILQLDPVLAERVVKRCEGNPLFIVQLVGDWVRRRVLRPSTAGWRLAPGEQRAPLPDDVYQLWLERVSAVVGAPSAAWESLELAAVLGQEFELTTWAEACRRRGVEPDLERLSAMADADLVHRRGAGWRFGHGLLVEALQNHSAARNTEAAQHAVAAAALKAVYPEPTRQVRYRIACHLLGARRPRAAVALLEAIAAEAENRLEPEALGAILDALEEAIESLGPVGDDDDALRATAALWTHRCRLALVRARLPEARRFARGALELARAGGWPDVELRALLAANAVFQLQHRLDEAEAATSRAAELVAEVGDPFLEARLHHRMAQTAARREAHERAVALYRRAAEGYEAVGERFLQGLLLAGLGSSLNALGRRDEADSVLREAAIVNRRLGQESRLADTQVQQGELARALNQPERAREMYDSAMHLYRRSGNLVGQPVALANLALLSTQAGDHAAAREHLDEAERVLRGSPNAPVRPILGALRLDVQSAAGQWDGLAALLLQVEGPIREHRILDPDGAAALARFAARATAHPNLQQRATALAEWMDSEADAAE